MREYGDFSMGLRKDPFALHGNTFLTAFKPFEAAFDFTNWGVKIK